MYPVPNMLCTPNSTFYALHSRPKDGALFLRRVTIIGWHGNSNSNSNSDSNSHSNSHSDSDSNSNSNIVVQ